MIFSPARLFGKAKFSSTPDPPAAGIYKTAGRLMLLISATALIIGCQTPSVKPPAPKGARSERLLIFPFVNMTRLFGVNESVRSPYSGHVFVTGVVYEDAERILTRRLTNLAERHLNYQVIPPDRSENLQIGSLTPEGNSFASIDEISRAGRRIGVDKLMVGHLFRFRERQGTAYAVKRPASVAFDMTLIDPRTGRVIWKGRFDETQRSLTENLLEFDSFVQRGGRWITARKMAEIGMMNLLLGKKKP
jgi:hypothetical protein